MITKPVNELTNDEVIAAFRGLAKMRTTRNEAGSHSKFNDDKKLNFSEIKNDHFINLENQLKAEIEKRNLKL